MTKWVVYYELKPTYASMDLIAASVEHALTSNGFRKWAMPRTFLVEGHQNCITRIIQAIMDMRDIPDIQEKIQTLNIFRVDELNNALPILDPAFVEVSDKGKIRAGD